MAHLLHMKFIEVAKLLQSEWRNKLPDSKTYKTVASLLTQK